MDMLWKILMFSLISASLAIEDQDTEAILDELSSLVSSKDDPAFDIDDENDISELKRVIEDHGFNPEELLSDFGFLRGLSDILSSGDGKRWTTLNFAYQLACYQGKGGSVMSKAWWAWRTYNGYGCYCGAGYYYGNYLDATDYCCKLHDRCYRAAMKKYKLKDGCHTYTTPYTVQCCKKKRITKCTDSGPSAGRALCDCDQAMSRCVSQHKAKSTYKKGYYNNRAQCRDTSGKFKKPMSPWEIFKSCKHYKKERVKFRLTYGSQGNCPAPKKKRWW